MNPTLRLHNFFSVAGVLIAVTALALPILSSTQPSTLSATNKTPAPVVRWQEGQPGCTFSRSSDGRYHYGFWSGDLGITLVVDSQELEKVRRRPERFFGVSLTVKYRGPASVDINPQDISLQFVKHFKVVQPALDPDSFAERVQNDADELDHQIARELQKHPEQKETKQASMRTFQKETAELIEFLSKSTLKPTRLDPANNETTGWVLFSTDSKWISGWKQQEEFLLRLPLAGKTFEFPFKLPPKEGELLLRQRE